MPLWVSGSKGVKSAFHIHPLRWYGLLRSGPSPRLLPKALKPVSAEGGRPRFRARSSEMLQRLSGKLCQVQPPSAPARGCLSRHWSVFVSSFFSRGPNSTFTLSHLSPIYGLQVLLWTCRHSLGQKKEPEYEST